MEECVFCKIIAGKLPCHKIYEDERTLCILTIDPAARGHCLVIPKKHQKGLFDMSEDDFAALARVTHHVSKLAVENLGATGVNLLHASGPGSQQSVFHYHMHVLPRSEGDGLNTWPETGYKQGEPLEKTAAEFVGKK